MHRTVGIRQEVFKILCELKAEIEAEKHNQKPKYRATYSEVICELLKRKSVVIDLEWELEKYIRALETDTGERHECMIFNSKRGTAIVISHKTDAIITAKMESGNYATVDEFLRSVLK